MKPFLSIVFSFIQLTAFGQNQPIDSGFANKSEAQNLMVNGKKEGKWVEYLESDSITTDTTAQYYLLTFYQSGLPVGISREYSKRGILLKETPFVNGNENGIEKGYYQNGALKYEAAIKNDTLNGVERDYDRHGALTQEMVFINGKKNGLARSFYKNGTLKSETPFKDDLECGIEKSYYPNGQLEEEKPIIDSINSTSIFLEINGLMKMYYPNGQLKLEIMMKKDKELWRKKYDKYGKEIK